MGDGEEVDGKPCRGRAFGPKADRYRVMLMFQKNVGPRLRCGMLFFLTLFGLPAGHGAAAEALRIQRSSADEPDAVVLGWRGAPV